MANKSIFQSLRGALVPTSTATNDAGATAYALSPKAALARIAATGCVTRTYYCSAEVQLDRVLALANEVTSDADNQMAFEPNGTPNGYRQTIEMSQFTLHASVGWVF